MKLDARSDRRLVAIGVLAIAAGCRPNANTPDAASTTQQDAPTMHDTPTTHDDGTSTGGDGSGSPGFSCRNTVTGIGDGHHNAGLNCMSLCHDHGFTVAGTVYTSSAATTPATGATVTVFETNGGTLELPVQQNGNFYTTVSVTFPITVYASDCPNVQMMTAPVASNDLGVAVGCTNVGCHSTLNATGVVHLP